LLHWFLTTSTTTGQSIVETQLKHLYPIY
jgi:hypothetical protein